MSPYMGGGFGAGLRPQYECVLATLGALALKRSVRLVLTRQQMYGLGYRPASIELVALGGSVGERNKRSQAAQRLEQRVMQRRLAKPARQLRVGLRSGLVVAQHLFVFQSAQEFKFAKLFGLKSTGRLEFATKGEEVRGQHGFKNRELLDQDPSDFCTTAKQASGLVYLIAGVRVRARGALRSASSRRGPYERVPVEPALRDPPSAGRAVLGALGRRVRPPDADSPSRGAVAPRLRTPSPSAAQRGPLPARLSRRESAPAAGRPGR